MTSGLIGSFLLCFVLKSCGPWGMSVRRYKYYWSEVGRIFPVRQGKSLYRGCRGEAPRLFKRETLAVRWGLGRRYKYIVLAFHYREREVCVRFFRAWDPVAEVWLMKCSVGTVPFLYKKGTLASEVGITLSEKWRVFHSYELGPVRPVVDRVVKCPGVGYVPVVHLYLTCLPYLSEDLGEDYTLTREFFALLSLVGIFPYEKEMRYGKKDTFYKSFYQVLSGIPWDDMDRGFLKKSYLRGIGMYRK